MARSGAGQKVIAFTVTMPTGNTSMNTGGISTNGVLAFGGITLSPTPAALKSSAVGLFGGDTVTSGDASSLLRGTYSFPVTIAYN